MSDSNEDPYSWDAMLRSSNVGFLPSMTAGINQEVNLGETPESGWEIFDILDPTAMCLTGSVPRNLSTQRENQDPASLSTVADFNFGEYDQMATSTTSDKSLEYTTHTELDAVDRPWSDSYNSSDVLASFSPYAAERQADQDEIYTQSSLLSQHSNHPRSRHGDRVLCRHAGCSRSFKTKTDMERHYHTKHEDGGIICGDCKNLESTNSKKRRSDHFLRHLFTEHGVTGATQKSVLTCPLELCRPTNPSQQLWFSTQEILNLHLQKAHGIASHSSRHVPLDQLLLSSSKELTESSGSLLNAKRLGEHNPLGASKRPRSIQSSVLDLGLEKEKKTKDDQTYSLSISTDMPALLYEIPGPETTNALMTCYINDISPYDFVKAKSLWHQVAKLLQEDFLVPGIPYLTFNARRRQIKVCLQTDLARKTIIPSIVKGLIDKGAVTEQASPEAHRYLHTGFCPLKPHRARGSDSAKVFPIRKTEDSEVISLWERYIVPALFNILDESVGGDYTASLVRAGDSPDSANPVIHIESPQLPGRATLVDIREQLDKACGRSLQEAGIEVRFFEGSLVLLAGGTESNSEPAEELRRTLPYFTRFQKHACMSASISLICTATEFATLGCYLNVNGEKHILTVDHFISKSYESRVTDHQNDADTLTSPAIAKVNRIVKELQQLEKNLAAELSAEISQNFPDGMQPEDLENSKQIFDIWKKLDEVQTWLQEHRKDIADFKIGRLSFRCEEGALAPMISSHSMVNSNTSGSLAAIDVGHRLDWALFRVDPADSRQGRNRYRYLNNNFHPEGDKIDEGEGDICQQTRVVKGGESVRFVGAGIGPHDGVVNGALQVVSHEGHKTLEHHIIMGAEYAKPACEYAGASGAVVLNIADNTIIGLLWGCSKSPIFTPIHTVFADIRRVTQEQEVELYQDSEFPAPQMPILSASTTEALLISGSERDALEPRPYKSEDIVLPPMTSEQKANSFKRLMSFFTASSKYPQRKTTTDIENESRTATPSLSSSRTSSPVTLPSTPNEQLNEALGISETTQRLVLVAGEDIEIASGSDVEDCDTFEGSSFEQLLRNKLATSRKFSDPPIIGDGEQMPKEQLFCPQPNRHWNIWQFGSEE